MCEGNFTYSSAWSVSIFFSVSLFFWAEGQFIWRKRAPKTFLHAFTINTQNTWMRKGKKSVLPMVSGFFFIIVFYSTFTDYQIKLRIHYRDNFRFAFRACSPASTNTAITNKIQEKKWCKCQADEGNFDNTWNRRHLTAGYLYTFYSALSIWGAKQNESSNVIFFSFDNKK